MSSTSPQPIIEYDLPDQTIVRPDRPIANLEEFLQFLEEIESLFGPFPPRDELTLGDRFLL